MDKKNGVLGVALGLQNNWPRTDITFFLTSIKKVQFSRFVLQAWSKTLKKHVIVLGPFKIRQQSQSKDSKHKFPVHIATNIPVVTANFISRNRWRNFLEYFSLMRIKHLRPMFDERLHHVVQEWGDLCGCGLWPARRLLPPGRERDVREDGPAIHGPRQVLEAVSCPSSRGRFLS